MKIEVDETQLRGHLKKTWCDRMKEDIKKFWPVLAGWFSWKN